MRSDFRKDIVDQVFQSLASRSHRLKYQQAHHNAIPLREVALYTNATRFLTANHHIPLEHQITNVLEANWCFDQANTPVCTELVERSGCGNRADNITGQPTVVRKVLQEHRKQAMTVYKAAM